MTLVNALSVRRAPDLIVNCGGVATRFTEAPAVRHFEIEEAWLDGARLSCAGTPIETLTPLQLAEAAALRRLPAWTALVLHPAKRGDLHVLEAMEGTLPLVLVAAPERDGLGELLDAMAGFRGAAVILGPPSWLPLLAAEGRPLETFDSALVRVFTLGDRIVLVGAGGEDCSDLWDAGGAVATWVQAWEIAVRLLAAIPGATTSDQGRWPRWRNRLRRNRMAARLLDAVARHGGLRRAMTYRLKAQIPSRTKD